MKFYLLCITLAALAAGFSASTVKSPFSRTNWSYGYVRPGDRLLNRTYVQQPAIPNTVQSLDVIYRGNYTTSISNIQVDELGYTQYATHLLLYGGIGANNVSIRIQSARGYGYNYLVDIWGR